MKKQAKETPVAEKAATKKAKRPFNAAATLGRQARREERFRELVAWYILQGVDEATAKRRAQDEMHVMILRRRELTLNLTRYR
jgi:hypothetical protein